MSPKSEAKSRIYNAVPSSPSGYVEILVILLVKYARKENWETEWNSCDKKRRR